MLGNSLAYAVVGENHGREDTWIAGVYATLEEAEAAIEQNFGATKRARGAVREWESEKSRLWTGYHYKHGEGDFNEWADRRNREVAEKLGERPPNPPAHVADAYWIEIVTIGQWRDPHVG